MAALIDLWKTSPAQVEQKTVQQVLAFAGDGKLKHDNPTSLEFRDFLGRVPSDLLGAYANQCLDLKGFPDSGLALQDVVNQIGRRLGFQVENGRYRGTPGAIGYDGLWVTKREDAIIVEVKTTDAYRLSLDVAAEYRRKLIAGGKVKEQQSSILYIVGRSDTGDLEAQVRGSRHAWDIRIISIDALLRLLKVKEELEDPETIDKIRQILTPREFTRVDGIIDLVFSAAKSASQEVSDLPPQFEESEKGKKFTPVKFREQCILRLQKHFNESLVQQTAAIYATPDERTAIYCGTSREYERTQGTGYWFGFRATQKEILDEYEKAWVTFGCGSEAQLLVIPLAEFAGWLERFNKTENEQHDFWHIHIRSQKQKWFIEARTGFDSIEVSKYFL